MNQTNWWDSWDINPNRKVNMRLPAGRSVIGSFPYGGKRKTVTSPIKLGPYTGGSERKSFSLSPLAIKEAGLAAGGDELPETELGFGKSLLSPGFLAKAIADLFKSMGGAESTRPIETVTGAAPSVGKEPTETKQIFVDERGGKTTVTYKRAEEIPKPKTTPIEGAPSPTRDVIGELGPIEGGARPAIGEGMPELPSPSKLQTWMSDPQNRLLLAGIAQAFGGPDSWQAGIGRMQEEAAIGELYKEALGETAYEGPTGYGVGPEFISNVLAQKTGAEELARKVDIEERKMVVGEKEITLREEQAEVAKRIGEAQIGQIRASTALDIERAKVAGVLPGVPFKVRPLDLFGDGTSWDVGITNRQEQFIIGRSAVSPLKPTERNVANRIAAPYVSRVREYLESISTGSDTDPMVKRAKELLMAGKLSGLTRDPMTGDVNYTGVLQVMSEFPYLQDMMNEMEAELKAKRRVAGAVPAGEIIEPEAWEGLTYE